MFRPLLLSATVLAGASVAAVAQPHPPIVVQSWEITSDPAPHPTARVCVETGFKLVGGGARVNWTGSGNLLTASYPEGDCWVGRSKDHVHASPASITVWAIGLRDSQNQWDVHVNQATGLSAAHPIVTVSLPWGYALTGGGGRINWTGAGNLLTASYPVSDLSWEVRGKDHEISDPATATAYIIGIRPRAGGPVQTRTTSGVSGTAAHPSVTVAVANGFTLTGGGARVEWSGAGNLLTSSFPSASNWIASAKDHDISSPAPIFGYAIGIR